MRLPTIRGTVLGIPIIRTIIFWSLHWGSLILRDCQLGSLRVCAQTSGSLILALCQCYPQAKPNGSLPKLSNKRSSLHCLHRHSQNFRNGNESNGPQQRECFRVECISPEVVQLLRVCKQDCRTSPCDAKSGISVTERLAVLSSCRYITLLIGFRQP